MPQCMAMHVSLPRRAEGVGVEALRLHALWYTYLRVYQWS